MHFLSRCYIRHKYCVGDKKKPAGPNELRSKNKKFCFLVAITERYIPPQKITIAQQLIPPFGIYPINSVYNWLIFSLVLP